MVYYICIYSLVAVCLQVDQMVPGSHGYTVVDDWDCMLNQTNIGQNNNKFYIIQMLLGAFQAYYVWTRWGRVVCSYVEEGVGSMCNTHNM